MLGRLPADDSMLPVDRLYSVEVLDGCHGDAALAYLGGEGGRKPLLAPVFFQKLLHLRAVALATEELAHGMEAEPVRLYVHALAVTLH